MPKYTPGGHGMFEVPHDYGIIYVLYSRDHKGLVVAHEKTSPASLFPDDNEAVLVR